MEFNDSGEFSRLPDEFNRGYREEVTAVTGKKKMLQLILCFFTLTVLIFPLTLRAADYQPPVIPDDPDLPVIIDDPEPSREEYSIIGRWRNGYESFYEFFEDGKGYWSNGKMFVLLHWQKEDYDYRITGRGLTSYGENSLELRMFDQLSGYANGNLILDTISKEGGWGIGEYVPSEVEFDMTAIMPLFDTPFSERIQGVWEHLMHLDREKDGIYTCLSYIEIEGDEARFLFASTVSGDWSEYATGYEFDEDYPDCKVNVGLDTYVELNDIEVSGKGTFSYNGYGLTLYSFITEDGEQLVADGLSSRTIMEKFEW